MPRRVVITVRAAAAVVVGAALVALVAIAWDRRGGDRGGASAEGAQLRELFAALSKEPTRPVEGRLADGFVYLPPPVRSRDGRVRASSADVRLVAVRIEKAARAAETAANSAALGVAFLATGEWGKAVEELEGSIDPQRRGPAIENNLAVAYLARADGGARPEDWVSALAAANRAIRLDPTRAEPHFNRALALQGLHLRDEEREAWQSFLGVERSGPWAAEAARRLDALEQRGAGAKPADHQQIRERIEDVLLTGWGAAILEGDDGTAAKLLREAEQQAKQLVSGGGDAMAHDEILAIRAASGQAVQALASGHRLYGAARQAFSRDNLSEASRLMSEAAEHFRKARSPYAQLAPVLEAILQRNAGQSQRGLSALETIPVELSSRYLYLRGRVAWVKSLLQLAIGRYDLSRDLLFDAVDAFRSGGEHDNLIATQTNLAEAEWFLGNRNQAWSSLIAALAIIEERGTTRRRAHFDLAATMAVGSGVPHAAIDFHNAFARLASSNGALWWSDALLRRARTLVRLQENRRAEADLMRASELLPEIDEPVLREQMAVEITISRAELLALGDCAGAMEHIEAALRRLTGAIGTVRRAAVLGMRARCRQSLGDLAGARADLLSSVQLFEQRRAGIVAATDRIAAFEGERAAFKQLIALEAGPLADDSAAFRTVERSREGVIGEVWNVIADVDHRQLPEDVAIVFYESLPDRVLIWVLTRERRLSFTRPVSEAALSRAVVRMQRAIREGATLATLRRHISTLFDELIAPALQVADDGGSAKTTLVFVPDGALFAVPFAALPDVNGRALLETRTVAVAPSFSTFLAASARLGAFTASDVLAVGDGHDSVSSGMPILPHADGEAADVGRMYPRNTVLTGAAATRERFLSMRARVIHFAGHSVLNERYPMLSRMLFAPSRSGADSGSLLATEITPERFSGTDVVVLATCDAAAGRPVVGEGAVSMARAFFAAGVPAVVASLWPVDDDLQTLVQTFHSTLQRERDPARALRAGQRALLASRGRDTPVRVWGGFIMLGGLPLARQEEAIRG